MITAFIGDSERQLKILPEHIEELETLTGSAIGALYGKVMSAQFHFKDLLTIVRLGLIGGGTPDRESFDLVDAYVKTRPVMQTLPIALDVLELLWSGETVSGDDDQQEVA
ncbi:gene transfer agent family protein [Ochrobactrum sp. Q0168]|uniref:gene transfer agent family protein n=1 Tax=Ochrobactrum sp. Q0168 TaxID=2793241 RepID=UPI0018EC9109|nr:gene transfer agent family protein [Ochrobactrum sp. Q0168]